jgi:hypothetical protein
MLRNRQPVGRDLEERRPAWVELGARKLLFDLAAWSQSIGFAPHRDFGDFAPLRTRSIFPS